MLFNRKGPQAGSAMALYDHKVSVFYKVYQVNETEDNAFLFLKIKDCF